MMLFSHLMLKYSATAPQKITNLHTQQSLDAPSFLYMKACLFINNCCWDVGMPACFSQFCWTCLLSLWEHSNTTSLIFAASGRSFQTGAYEYYSLDEKTTPTDGSCTLKQELWLCKPGLKYNSWGTHNIYSILGRSCLRYYLICNCQIKQSQKLSISLLTQSGCISISTYTSATTWLLKLFRLYEPELIK